MNIRIKTKLDLFIAAVTDGMGTDRQHDQGMVRLFRELLGKDPKVTLPPISFGQLQASLQMYSACLEEYMNLLIEMKILMVGPNTGRYSTFCLTDHARGQFVKFQNGVIPDQDDWHPEPTPLIPPLQVESFWNLNEGVSASNTGHVNLAKAVVATRPITPMLGKFESVALDILRILAFRVSNGNWELTMSALEHNFAETEIHSIHVHQVFYTLSANGFVTVSTDGLKCRLSGPFLEILRFESYCPPWEYFPIPFQDMDDPKLVDEARYHLASHVANKAAPHSAAQTAYWLLLEAYQKGEVNVVDVIVIEENPHRVHMFAVLVDFLERMDLITSTILAKNCVTYSLTQRFRDQIDNFK